MAFVKGDSRINRKGRPPRKPTDITLKERIFRFMDSHWEQIERDFMAMEPRERVQLFERFMAYKYPKPREMNLDIQMEHLSDDQLDEIANRIMKNYDENE